MSSSQVRAFRQQLIEWGKEHFRSLPWRLSGDPYRLLMAEVMLHRTQAVQVVPAYESLVTRYPNISALATEDREEIRRILYPLGLRWRADMVYEMIRELINRFEETVPCDKHALMSLPGVSDYIASAVRCFAWNLPEPLIDTNVVRVVARVFGLHVNDSARKNNTMRMMVGSLVDPGRPREYNYALLDLAASVCTARRPPRCAECPVLTWCVYGQSRT